MQDALLKQDGFQRDFCTPAQNCSSVGLLAVARAGTPSHETTDLQGIAARWAMR